jgi:UDP-4-amino-4-deoxy-L-arabinose-oxoglutarate aminotransferase
LKKYPYLIIEDHCQSFGLNEPLYGSAAIYSFYATKCLTTGEGGAAAFMDRDLLDRANSLRRSNIVPGSLSDLQAVLGLSQLSRYDEMLSRRREIALRYLNELPKHVTQKLSEVTSCSIFYRFPLCMRGDFDSFSQLFAERGIAVGRAVSVLLHRLAGMKDEDFPNAVEAFDTTVSIPIYPAMSDDDVSTVIDAVKTIARA